MRVIPAIDILEGKVVRLSQGRFDEVTPFDVEPVNKAIELEKQGFKHLHLVDLDGARSGAIENFEIIKSILSKTNLKIDFGGGIKNEYDLKNLFDIGVNQVNIGSMAVKEPQKFQSWIKHYGAEKFILSADVRGKKIFIDGWRTDSGKTLDEVIEYFLPHGIYHVACTEITKDGMMHGPAHDLYQELINKYPNLNVIASGGISTLENIKELKIAGCYGVIVGKALLQGKIKASALIENELEL